VPAQAPEWKIYNENYGGRDKKQVIGSLEVEGAIEKYY